MAGGDTMVQIQRLSASFGAVVEGLDLESIGDAEFEALHDAVVAHQVVFLRDQHLSADGQRSLARRFGAPIVVPILAHYGATEALMTIEDNAENPPDTNYWHTDTSWVERPPTFAILCGLVIPPTGGDTMWADLYGAYDRLSPPMRTALEALQVRHEQGEVWWASVERGTRTPEQVAELRGLFPGAVHPLVQVHPESGRPTLFLAGEFMGGIVGMHPEESTWLLSWLRSLLDDPTLQVRWSWREGDVAIWDERSTNHRALADHYPQHRRMRRITVGDDRVD